MAKAIPFPGMEEEKPKNNINVKAIPFPDMQMNTEQNISQPVNQPQPQYNDGNIFTDTAKDFAGGSARLFGNIANGARWLGKFVYSAAAQPQNAFAELTGNEQMKVDSSDAFKIPGFNLIEEGLDSYSDASNQAAETIFDSKSMESKQLGNNMIESLKEGRFMDFGKQLVSVTAQTAPNILLAMMGGFAGTAAQGLGATSTAGSMLGTSNVLSQALPKAVIGLSAAGGEYRETEGGPELSDQQELLSAGVKGTSEVIWESLVTLPMIDDIVRTNKIAGDQMQKGIEWGLANWLKSGAKGGLSEAGEEMGTEATNYISDVIIKGKQFNADEFTSLVANAGLGAIATGAILSSVGDYRQNNAQNLRYDINQIIKAERMMEDLKREARYERNQKEQRRIEKISRQLNQKKTEMQQQEEMERQRQQSGEATQNAFQGFQGTMAEQKAAAVAKQRILENLINNQQDLNTFTVNIDNNNYAIVRNMNDNILVDVFQGNQRQGTMTAESMEELFTVLANNGYDLSTVTPFETATREQVQQAEIAENQPQAAQNLLSSRQKMINDIVGRINQYGGQVDLSQYDMPTAADDVDTVRQKSLNVLSDLRKQLVEARQNYTPQPQQQGDVAQTPIEQPNNVDNTIENENQTDEGLNTQPDTTVEETGQYIQQSNEQIDNFREMASQENTPGIPEELQSYVVHNGAKFDVIDTNGNTWTYQRIDDAINEARKTRAAIEGQPIQEGQQQQEGIVEDEGQQEYELNKYEKYFLDKKYQDEGFSKKEIEFWREKESFNALIRAANKVANKFGEKAGYEYLEKRAFSEPTKKVKAEDIDTSDIPIEISPNDLDNELLIRAFRGTSHTPKDRADLLKRSYINHIKDLYNELNEIVGNETQRKVLTDELQKYKENYIKKLNDYLSSQSRVSSPMIAGPANFNTRQNDKRAKAAQNKRKAMVEWQEKAKKSIRRKIKKQEGEVVGEQQENEIELTPKDKKQIKEAGRKAYNYVKKTSETKGKVVTTKDINKAAEKARQEAEIEERQKIISRKRETAISNAIKREDKQKRKTENENRKTGSAALTEWGQEIADREIITAIYDLVKGDLDRITIDIEEGNISKDKVNQILDKAREVEMLNEPTYNFYKERFNNVETTENQQFKQDLYDKQTTEFEEIFNKAREAGLEISKDEFDLPNSQASVDDIGREYNKAIDEIEKRLEKYQSEQVEEFAQEKAQERMEEIEGKSSPTRQDTLEYRLWQHINGDINSDELFDNLKIVKRSKTRDIMGSYTERKDMIKDLIEKSKNFNQTIKINTPGGYIEIENKPPIYSEREKGKVVTPRGPLVISDIIMALGGTDQSGVFKGETVKTGKPDIDTSQLAEPNNYYIFDNEGEFVQVLKAKPISIPGTEDMDLFRYRIKDQVGKIKNKKTTTPPNYWIITEGKSGAKMSVGRTIKEAAKNLKESFDKTPVETIKSKVNDLIKEGNISPRWGKIIRYEVGNENNNVKKSIETNKTLFGKEPKNININGKNVKMSRNAVEFSQKNKYARAKFTLNDKKIEMPELLDIILALSEGKYPGIIKKLSNTGTLGYYMPKDGSIGLNPDIFIGPTIHQEKIPNKQYDRRIQEIRTRIENDPEIGEVEFKTKFTKNYVEVRVLEVDPEFAAQTMSHELGHLIDFIPRSELDEGELMDNMSLIYKGEKDETLDAIRDSKKLGPRLKKELQRLSQKWKPFDTSNKKYRQYRFSPEELYADAMSVFFLDPEMLQQEAPLFSQFIQKSISEKPAVKKSYNTVRHLMENRSEMINKTFDNLQEGMVDGVEQTKKKIQRRERGVKSGFDWLIESFIDKNSALYKYFRGEYSDTGEKGKLSREARNKMEEIAYMSSEVEDYLYNIGQIIEGLSNYDIDFLDFNSFLFNKRVLGDRRKYANPLFVNTVRAEEMQQALLDKYGEEKYQKIVNAAEKYYQLRQERIIPIMEKSNMFTEAAMEKVKNNKEYVTFEVVDYINTEFGEGTGDIIMRQYGTGRKISNPLVATMLKDMSIISSIRINESKVAAVKALKKIAPESIRQAPTKEIYGKIIPKDSTDADEGLITFTVNGKLDGYLVEKDIADLYEYTPHKANAATNTILSIVQGMKSIIVSHNPRWMIFNIPRDFFATVMNNPEIGIKDIPALAHEYKKAFSEAWNNVRHNKRSEDISYMRRNRMLTIDRMYRPSDSYMEDDTQQLLTEIFDYNEQSGEEHSRLQKLIPDKVRSAWEGLDNFGQVAEMAGQIAGYRMLSKRTNLSEGDLAHRVRTRVGTPDFKQRGALHSITNNLFIFSTIRKSGWTAAAESFRQNPGTFLFKLALFSLLPKLLQLGAEEADELFPNSEFAKKIAETMEGVSEYKKETYLVVPVWKANGKAITIQLPQDFIGQAVTSAVYNAARGEWGDVAGTVWTELPWNTSNLNPLLQAAADVQRLTSGENIYDTWRGRNVISEEAMLTGNVGQKLKEFGLYEFFNLGGSAIVNPSIAYADGTLEALSNIIPFNAVKRLISISESGYYEDVTKVYQDQKKYTQMVANYNNSRRYGEDLRYSRKEIMEAKRNLSQLNKLIRHFANINRQIKYAQSQGKKETVDKLERQKINLARRYNGKEPLSD